MKFSTMESSLGWALAGIKVKTGEEFLDEELSQQLLIESFKDDAVYKVFLCGAVIEKTGSLQEMEDAYHLLKAGMEDFDHSDFAIIVEHDEADLLFIPIEEETIQDENA